MRRGHVPANINYFSQETTSISTICTKNSNHAFSQLELASASNFALNITKSLQIYGIQNQGITKCLLNPTPTVALLQLCSPAVLQEPPSTSRSTPSTHSKPAFNPPPASLPPVDSQGSTAALAAPSLAPHQVQRFSSAHTNTPRASYRHAGMRRRLKKEAW